MQIDSSNRFISNQAGISGGAIQWIGYTLKPIIDNLDKLIFSLNKAGKYADNIGGSPTRITIIE